VRRARLRTPGQLWGRRTILAGLALIAIAAVGGLVLLADGDDGDSATPAQEFSEEQQGGLDQTVDDPGSGISASWPSEWRKLERGEVTAFQSPDRTVMVAISAPTNAANADQLRRDAIASATAGYKNPEVRQGKGRTIGGLRAEGATISGNGPGGQSSSLVAVAAGKQNAYLLEVFTTANAPSGRLVEAQLILNSLRLTK
jgi:hypothetical protein